MSRRARRLKCSIAGGQHLSLQAVAAAAACHRFGRQVANFWLELDHTGNATACLHGLLSLQLPYSKLFAIFRCNIGSQSSQDNSAPWPCDKEDHRGWVGSWVRANVCQVRQTYDVCNPRSLLAHCWCQGGQHCEISKCGQQGWRTCTCCRFVRSRHYNLTISLGALLTIVLQVALRVQEVSTVSKAWQQGKGVAGSRASPATRGPSCASTQPCRRGRRARAAPAA